MSSSKAWVFVGVLALGAYAYDKSNEPEPRPYQPAYTPTYTPAQLPTPTRTGYTPTYGGGDLDCSDIQTEIYVGDYDPNGLDADNDGWGCESYGDSYEPAAEDFYEYPDDDLYYDEYADDDYYP